MNYKLPNALMCVVAILCAVLTCQAQDCTSGAIRTIEPYLYGRFEVAMQSAEGSGVVSSFFLYNSDVDCNWPDVNNEIDIEMTGNNETVQFTTHYPPQGGSNNTYSMTWDETYGFNPHDAIYNYAFEWEPGIVRWYIDNELVHTQDQLIVSELIHPMRIHMNLWAAEATGWVGPWDPSIMPLQSEYEYVRYYEWTPGTGDAGTNNDFSFVWEDEFNNYNDERWEISEFGGFQGNYCSFESPAVEFENGRLILKMLEPNENTETIPVTFSVDMSEEDLNDGDAIYLNGSFNNWCGNCAPMTENDGLWTTTIELEPGRHQYLFTKNFWEENGGAPLGSSCDFEPCDEYVNYGFILSYGQEPLVLGTPCWASCEPCLAIGIDEVTEYKEKALLHITDLLGRKIQAREGQILLFYFDDGSVEKRFSVSVVN